MSRAFKPSTTKLFPSFSRHSSLRTSSFPSLHSQYSSSKKVFGVEPGQEVEDVLLRVDVVRLQDHGGLVPPVLEESRLADEGSVSIVHPCQGVPPGVQGGGGGGSSLLLVIERIDLQLPRSSDPERESHLDREQVPLVLGHSARPPLQEVDLAALLACHLAFTGLTTSTSLHCQQHD